MRPAGLKDEGDGIGDDSAAAKRDQRAERMGTDQRVLDLQAILAVVRRLIHRRDPFDGRIDRARCAA